MLSHCVIVFTFLCAAFYIAFVVATRHCMKLESDYYVFTHRDYLLAFLDNPMACIFATVFGLFVLYVGWWFIIPQILTEHIMRYYEVRYVV